MNAFLAIIVLVLVYFVFYFLGLIRIVVRVKSMRSLAQDFRLNFKSIHAGLFGIYWFFWMPVDIVKLSGEIDGHSVDVTDKIFSFRSRWTEIYIDHKQMQNLNPLSNVGSKTFLTSTTELRKIINGIKTVS